MPGLFGIITSNTERLKSFSELCQSYSPFSYKIVRATSYCIGAHAFQGKGILENPQHVISVDGEYDIYQTLANSPQELFNSNTSYIKPTEKSKGNLCVLDKDRGVISLATDSLGSFPLYYFISKDAFIFSSRIKPIAHFIDAEHDNAGIMEFLFHGNNINNRTYFKGIYRCRAGEILTLNINDLDLKIENYSKLWAQQPNTETRDDLIDHASLLLKNSFDSDRRTMLMMSAGWDSRTLLAAGVASGKAENFKAYAHGDISCREIEIVNRICEDSGTELFKQALSSEMYSPERLQDNLNLAENVVFPHWHLAGERAKDLNIQQITAGIFGEAFGGHYGPPCILQGSKKMLSVGKYLLDLHRFNSNKSQKGDAIKEAAALLKMPSVNKLWFISDEYWDTYIDEILQQYNQDVDDILLHYQQRGIETIENYIEAYTTEQRGSQYIAAQLLSCRHHTDICLPFADRNYIEFATRLPFETKVHNKLNQSVIKSIAPELLNYPMAATLLSANHSIISQEASRAVRKALDASRWKLHKLSKGRIKEPRMGWPNFKFLAEDDSIMDVIDSLKQPYWDKNKMKSWINNIEHADYHPLSDMLMKILTVDYCLTLSHFR